MMRQLNIINNSDVWYKVYFVCATEQKAPNWFEVYFPIEFIALKAIEAFQ